MPLPGNEADQRAKLLAALEALIEFELAYERPASSGELALSFGLQGTLAAPRARKTRLSSPGLPTPPPVSASTRQPRKNLLI